MLVHHMQVIIWAHMRSWLQLLAQHEGYAAALLSATHA
jgi:hypothetical protein